MQNLNVEDFLAPDRLTFGLPSWLTFHLPKTESYITLGQSAMQDWLIMPKS